MKHHFVKHLRSIGICMIGFVLLVLLSACAGVNGVGSNGTVSVTGSVKSIDTTNGAVTLDIQGQTITIKGLTAAQLSAIQPNVGKVFSISATPNSDGSYTINNGTNPINDENNPGVTPGIQTETTTDNNTPNTNTPDTATVGSVSFIGKVQSVSNSSIVVNMPNGKSLTMSIVNGQTDMGDFNGSLPTLGQLIKVDADANSNGSFAATKLGTTDSSNLQDQNIVDFKGVTTSAVGSDHIIHFKVGNQVYSFTPNTSTDLGDFNNNVQSINANQSIKVTVLYQGANATVQKVGN